MSGYLKGLGVSALIACSLAVFSVERTVIAKIKVDIKLEDPPSPSVSSSPTSASRVTYTPRWLVLRVDYAPQTPRDEGANKQSTYLDGVRMLVSAEFPISGGNKSIRYGLFKGEQTFWTMNCDGRVHTAMMFIPPHLLERYMYMIDTGTQVRTPGKGDFRAEVVFLDRSGAELGRGYYGVSGSPAKQQAYFQRMEKLVPENCVIDGAFLERGVTPWSCMAPDQFDMLKPASVKIPDAPIPSKTGVTLRGPKARNKVLPPKVSPGDLSVEK